MTVKLKTKKILGLILAIYLLSHIVSLVGGGIGTYFSSHTYFLPHTYFLSYIRIIPLIILAVSFFVKNERTHNIVMAVSFFSGCLFEITTIFQTDIRISYIPAICYLIIYGLIGYSIVSNKSNKKIIVAIFIFAMATLCFDCMGSNFGWSLWLAIRKCSVFGFIELIIVVLDMLSYESIPENNVQQGIVISNELINFKDLLQFIENEYKSGKISEQEYNRKRNEILSKL